MEIYKTGSLLLNNILLMKTFKLNIKEPCHENWNEMTHVEVGRHCDSCNKQFFDFTKNSDYEIKDFFKHNYGKNICGGFSRTN